MADCNYKMPHIFPLTMQNEGQYHTVVFQETPRLPIYCIGIFFGHLVPTHCCLVRTKQQCQQIMNPTLPCSRITSWTTAGDLSCAHTQTDPYIYLLCHIYIYTSLTPGTPTKLVNFAMSVAADAFTFLSSLFDNVLYPLTKVDLLALPKSRWAKK